MQHGALRVINKKYACQCTRLCPFGVSRDAVSSSSSLEGFLPSKMTCRMRRKEEIREEEGEGEGGRRGERKGEGKEGGEGKQEREGEGGRRGEEKETGRGRKERGRELDHRFYQPTTPTTIFNQTLFSSHIQYIHTLYPHTITPSQSQPSQHNSFTLSQSHTCSDVFGRLLNTWQR